MPTYKLKLEVEVTCPTREGQPELTITPREVKEALLKTSSNSNGYAVCAPAAASKLTATLHIKKVEFEPLTCDHCGNKVDVP